MMLHQQPKELVMKTLRLTCIVLGSLIFAAAANAQTRGSGWEFGADAIYQSSKDIDFKGGSSASLDDDFGLSLAFGYRFSDRLEMQFYLDWSNVDYDVALVTQLPGGGLGTATGTGSLEAFTPRAAITYNFSEGPLTPFVTAGIGWSFIDTNIPEGRPETVCWWDPWWGYVCGNVQDSKSIDGLNYDLGLGLRWDFSPGYSMRFGYEKHWIDLSEANGTPDLDQFKIGILYRY